MSSHAEPAGPTPFQREVAAAALGAAGQWGFALAGGLALNAHAIVRRPTSDVDLFTDAHGVLSDAAEAVTATLAARGMTVTARPDDSDVLDLFEGAVLDLAEFDVVRGGDRTLLQLARFDRAEPAVLLDGVRVLHPDDIAASKCAAMLTRAEPRDYVDVAALLDRYSRDELLALARRADTGIGDDDITESMRFLDAVPEEQLTFYGLTSADVERVRHQLADWPR